MSDSTNRQPAIYTSTIQSEYLSIAGFTIELNYSTIYDNDLSYSLHNFINSYYSGAIIVPQNKKSPDYSIYFIANDEFKFVRNKKISPQGKEYFIRIFSLRGKSTYVDFHIGIAQFQFLLKLIISELLSQSDGFILHASGISDGKRLFLFLGENGAGKSTIVNNLRDHFEVFADDSVIVRLVKGSWIGYQMPLEKNNVTYCSDLALQVQMLGFIKKGKGMLFHAISLPLAVKKLKQQILHFADSNINTTIFNTCLEKLPQCTVFECSKTVSRSNIAQFKKYVGDLKI